MGDNPKNSRSINASIRILVSAYACGPNWGSEIGMGWNWVINLSNYCQLTVITEKGFEKEINERMPYLQLKYSPKFCFINIGDKGRKLFWRQGSFLFYHYYKAWQKEAYLLAIDLLKAEKFDLIHQLNMIGFREPGYLWKIQGIPFVWGPVGGYNQIPWAYIPKMNLKNAIFYTIKNFINLLQIQLLQRPKEAAKCSLLLFAANEESLKILNHYTIVNPIVLNETGCSLVSDVTNANHNIKEKLEILWVGRLQGGKALPIAIETLALLKNQISFSFTIIGDGPDEIRCKKLAERHGLSGSCIWKGRISNDEVISIMRKSDFLFFTSLKEGTPHVVTEAIQNGLPVLCHDSGGQGEVIDSNCGLKVPMINYNESILGFYHKILELSNNPHQLVSLSKGAFDRAKVLSWNNKALFMYHKYLEVLQQNDKIN